MYTDKEFRRKEPCSLPNIHYGTFGQFHKIHTKEDQIHFANFVQDWFWIEILFCLSCSQRIAFLCCDIVVAMPFAFCTRERYPWSEFAEPITGKSVQFIQKVGCEYNILSICAPFHAERVL